MALLPVAGLLLGNGAIAFLWRHKIYTVDRTGRNAQLTTSAFRFDDRVHLFGRSNNRICWTGLYTFGAAYTLCLPDKCRSAGAVFTVFPVQGYNGYVQEACQAGYGSFSTGWTFVDGISRCDGFGVGQAAAVITSLALGLRQQCIDGINQGLLGTGHGRICHGSGCARDSIMTAR